MLYIRDSEFEKFIANKLHIGPKIIGSISYKDHDGYGGFAYFIDKYKLLNVIAYGQGKWLTKETINVFTAYPFDYLNANAIYAKIKPNNIQCLNMANRFFGIKGFDRGYVTYCFTRQSLRMFKLHGLDNKWLREADKK